MSGKWSNSVETIANKQELMDAFEILIPECLDNERAKSEVFGGSKDWMMFELVVSSSFIFTMVILMIKSRFMNIGIDHSY